MRDFNHTVNVLVKAYFDGVLLHQECYACAVGNIIAESIGANICKEDRVQVDAERYIWRRGIDYIGVMWPNVFITGYRGVPQVQSPEFYRGAAKLQIDKTGYSWKELARIESAFEQAEYFHDVDAWNFSGLMAVVDVLAEINGIDLEAKEKAKGLFVKA